MSKITKNILEEKIKDINIATNLGLKLESESNGEKIIYTIYKGKSRVHRGTAYDTNKFLEGVSCGISLYLKGVYNKFNERESSNNLDITSNNLDITPKNIVINGSLNKLLSELTQFRIVALREANVKIFSGTKSFYDFEIRSYSQGKLRVDCKITKELLSSRKLEVFDVGYFEMGVSDCLDLQDFGMKILKKVDKIVYQRMLQTLALRGQIEWLLWIDKKRQKSLIGTYVSENDTKSVDILSIGG